MRMMMKKMPWPRSANFYFYFYFFFNLSSESKLSLRYIYIVRSLRDAVKDVEAGPTEVFHFLKLGRKAETLPDR